MGQTKIYKKFQNNPLKTKDDFAQSLNDMFEPLLPYFSEAGAQVRLFGSASFDHVSSYLEGFSRPLWGLIPLAKGGSKFDHWDLYRKGLQNGSNPEHPEYWGDPSKEYNQRCVEMAAIGFGLSAIPDVLYHPLSNTAKDHLARWLATIQYAPVPINNWLFFVILVQEGLINIGRDDLVDYKIYTSYLDQILKFYRYDGWYSDGVPPAGGIDYYNGFALHFYGLLYAYIHQDSPNDYSEKFKIHADEFAKNFIYWFTNKGDGLPIGRSLTYRFAMGSFWGILASFGHSEFSLAQIKGLWARHLRYWQDKPIFALNNTLSRGYLYESNHLCERYNSPTSPYWAFKYFAPLMLSDDHRFWQTEEAPLPALKRIYPIKAADMIIRHNGDHLEAETALEVPLHMRHKDRYNKMSYSTDHGFGVDANNGWSFSDNILLFSHDKEFWQFRTKIWDQKITEDHILSYGWSAGAEVKGYSYSFVLPDYTIRYHDIELCRDTYIVECGYSVSGLLDVNKKFFLLHEIPSEKEKGDQSYMSLKGNYDKFALIADIKNERLALSNNLYPNTNVLFEQTYGAALVKHYPKGRVRLKTLISTNIKYDKKEVDLLRRIEENINYYENKIEGISYANFS